MLTMVLAPGGVRGMKGILMEGIEQRGLQAWPCHILVLGSCSTVLATEA